jgi:hypothetical protein
VFHGAGISQIEGGMDVKRSQNQSGEGAGKYMSKAFTVAYVVLALAISLSAKASAPEVLTIKNGKLERSTGGTIVEEQLKNLRERHGVEINTSMLAGFILDLDATDDDYFGVDLISQYKGPFFEKWLHNPDPTSKEVTKDYRKMTEYIETGKTGKDGKDLARWASALPEIDHVYLPIDKFDSWGYCNNKTGEFTGDAYEALLHESLHVWQFRNIALVNKLLKSSGGYFDRVKKSDRVCKNYVKVSEGNAGTCGFPSVEIARKTMVASSRWPQRYGPATDRKSCRETNDVCKSGETRKVINKISYCEVSNDSGDMHALDSQYEYFAIMMQLYVFDHAEFDRVATPTEKEFAKWLFSKGIKEDSSASVRTRLTSQSRSR